MSTPRTRRELLKGSLAVAGLGALGIPEWLLPALAEGDVLVPFTDLPASVGATAVPAAAAERRTTDIARIDGPFTPRDQFFTMQHYGHPVVDPGTFQLKVSGLVSRPQAFSLDDLRKMGALELVAGFECSGTAGRCRVSRRTDDGRASRFRRCSIRCG